MFALVVLGIAISSSPSYGSAYMAEPNFVTRDSKIFWLSEFGKILHWKATGSFDTTHQSFFLDKRYGYQVSGNHILATQHTVEKTQVALLGLDTLPPTIGKVLEIPKYSESEMAVSADGLQLAVLSRKPGKVRNRFFSSVDVFSFADGSKKSWDALAEDQNIFSTTFSPDGTELLIASVMMRTGSVCSPSYIPDSDGEPNGTTESEVLCQTYQWGPANLQFWNLETQAIRTWPQKLHPAGYSYSPDGTKILAASFHHVTVYTRNGAFINRRTLPDDQEIVSIPQFSIDPSEPRIVVLTRRHNSSRPISYLRNWKYEGGQDERLVRRAYCEIQSAHFVGTNAIALSMPKQKMSEASLDLEIFDPCLPSADQRLATNLTPNH